MTDVAGSLREEIRSYVQDNFMYLHPGIELRDEDEFLTVGVVDSLGFVELVEFVQSRYGVTVEDVDVTEENFGSIAAIASYVERKRNAL